MIKFGTAGIRGPVPENISYQHAISIGRALVDTDPDAKAPVVIGRDARVTSHHLAHAVAAGIAETGRDVIRSGQIPTPVLAHASQGRTGVMITASHNPPQDNGFKVFEDGIEIGADRESAIEQRFDSATPVSWDSFGHIRTEECTEQYLETAIRYITDIASRLELPTETPLEGTAIGIDAGTGVAGSAVSEILHSLGGGVCSIDAQPDGTFPARQSKPTPASLASTCSFVEHRHRAGNPLDVTVAFDGDGDRIVVIDDRGGIIHEDTILALLSSWYLHLSEYDSGTVVTTPNASARIDEAVESIGGTVLRTPLGTIQQAMAHDLPAKATEPIVFGGEPWKHVHPACGPWIDAIVSAGVLALLVAKEASIRSLTADIASPPYVKQSIPCPANIADSVLQEVTSQLTAAFPNGEQSISADSIRITFGQFEWLLIRPSGTEPKIRVYAEGEQSTTDRLETVIDLLERGRQRQSS